MPNGRPTIFKQFLYHLIMIPCSCLCIYHSHCKSFSACVSSSIWQELGSVRMSSSPFILHATLDFYLYQSQIATDIKQNLYMDRASGTTWLVRLSPDHFLKFHVLRFPLFNYEFIAWSLVMASCKNQGESSGYFNIADNPDILSPSYYTYLS